jgi:hypothetical protein
MWNVKVINMDTCPQELFDTCPVQPPAESNSILTSAAGVLLGVSIGLLITVVARRYPLFDLVSKLVFLASFVFTLQSTPRLEGSRVFLILLFSILGLYYAADYYLKQLRGTRFFVVQARDVSLLVGVYLVGVAVHFYFTASPDITYFTSMDQHLVGTSCLVWEYGWFYAVAVAQVTLTFFVAARKVVLSSSELQQMRTAEFNDYRIQLLKSGVFTAGMVALQGLSLYFSTTSATEIGTSIGVVLALLGRLGV